MVKHIEFDKNSQLLLEGCEKVARPVASTMGPKGRNVILKKTFGNPRVTKDGVSVAREIELEGIPGVGARLLIEAAVKSNSRAGDGTTTATVLGAEIARQGFKLVSAGYNPIGVQRGAQYFSEQVVEQLEKMSIPVKTADDIYNVALVSANGDESIATIVKDAFVTAGKEGVVIVEDSKDVNTHIEHSQGMQIDRGFLSRAFVTNINSQVAEYENPAILLVKGKLRSQIEFVSMLENHIDANGSKVSTFLKDRPLVIIASDYDDSVLAFFVYNRTLGMPIVVLKAPGFGDRQAENIDDISLLINAKTVDLEGGISLADVDDTYFGSCKKVISTIDDTTIISDIEPFEGEPSNDDEKYRKELWEKIKVRKQEIEGRIEEVKTKSEYDADKLRERLARLTKGLVTIRVGGSTDVEVKEKRDRYDDAISAVKASYKKGILPGGGVAFLRARSVLNNCEIASSDKDFDAGWEMMKEVLEKPLKVIVDNAGKKSDYIVEKVVELESENINKGYDARNDVYVDMIEAGIIDPTLVVTEALKNAVSVGTLIFTSSSTVLEEPKEECNCNSKNKSKGF